MPHVRSGRPLCCANTPGARQLTAASQRDAGDAERWRSFFRTCAGSSAGGFAPRRAPRAAVQETSLQASGTVIADDSKREFAQFLMAQGIDHEEMLAIVDASDKTCHPRIFCRVLRLEPKQ